MDTKTHISDLLAMGLSQAEIAAEAGCSQPHISLLHSGKRGARTSEDLAKRIRKVWSKRRRALTKKSSK